MTTIDLPEPVGDALAAVAAVDDTDPSSLAGMVLADWLASHRDRFTRAAHALDRLANGAVFAQRYVLGLEQEDGPDPQPEVEPDPQPSDDIDANPIAAEVTPNPPDEHDPDPAPPVNGHPCPECDRVLASPQGLGGHRAKVHPKHKPSKGKTEPTPDPVEQEDQDDGEPAGRCSHCGGIALDRYTVEGEPACSSCWRDAGRPR